MNEQIKESNPFRNGNKTARENINKTIDQRMRKALLSKTPIRK
jgi:hypothetical protein